jgi:hypothetical protein
VSTGSSVFNMCQSDNYLAQRNYFRRTWGALRQSLRISYSTEFDFHDCLHFARQHRSFQAELLSYLVRC